MLYFEINCEIILFRSLMQVSENTPKIISIGPPIKQTRPFKKLKILSILAPFISKIKLAEICNFLSVKYFGKHLSFLKIWHIRVNYCWSYGPSNLQFRFTAYSLHQLNNKQMKTSVNLLTHFFEIHYQKECLVKVSSFLIHWP